MRQIITVQRAGTYKPSPIWKQWLKLWNKILESRGKQDEGQKLVVTECIYVYVSRRQK